MASTSGSLDRSLVRGLAWTGGIRWMGQLVSWGTTIVVARLLTPADYGLAGMAAVYTGFALLFCEAGLTAALLRRSHTDTVAQAQLGGFAALLGLGCCLISVLIAHPLALFFGESEVREIVTVSSLAFIPRGLQVLPRGVLARALDFRRLAWIDGLEALGLAAVTLTLALAGAGVWALVLGSLIGAFIGAALSFFWSPVRLAWPRDLRDLAGDVIFGSKVLGAQLAWYLYSNADFAVVGWLLGSGTLGAYTIAWTIANVPVDRISALVSRVSPAYFAALRHDRAELRRYLTGITEGLALMAFPLCVGLCLVASDLVAVVLGPAWGAAVAPLQILALIATARAIFVLVPPILVFTGEVDRNLWFSVTCALTLPLAFAFAAQWGVVAVALAWLLVYPFYAGAYLFRHALRALELPWSGYASALRAPAIATAAMAVTVLLTRALWHAEPGSLHRLVTEAAIGAVTYTAVGFLLAGRRVRRTLRLLKDAGRTTSSERGSGRPRLLVVTYHFPPDPAVGGLRWRKLAHHALARGWDLDVISLDPGALPRVDPAGLSDLPPTTRVFHVPLPRLPIATFPSRCWHWLRSRRRVAATASGGADSHATTLLRWWPRGPRDLVRHYFAWLDRHRGRQWGFAAARQAQTLLRSGEYAAVISSGPPHPPHGPIAALAREEGVPFVLDLRDPWSLVQRLPEAVASPLWIALARRDQRRCIDGAALVLASSEPHRDALRRAYPGAAARILAIRNGCDDDPLPTPHRNGRFAVRYAGSIYLDRDPRPLFRAAARLITTEQLTPAEFGLEFMGEVGTHDGVSLEELARQAGIGEFVRCIPSRPRSEALAFLAGATMLVLLPQDSDMAIPAKVFEYVRCPAWLLALAEPESATARLLAGSGADVISAADEAQIRAVLGRRLHDHRAGVVPPDLATDRRFDRAAQAKLLFDALDQVTPAVAGATA